MVANRHRHTPEKNYAKNYLRAMGSMVPISASDRRMACKVATVSGFQMEHEESGTDYLLRFMASKTWLKNVKSTDQKFTFYDTQKWQRLRYKALQLNGRQCQCCGGVPPDVALQVDHILPRSKYPELQYDLDNLQVLCSECNQGKGNNYKDDFRPSNDT